MNGGMTERRNDRTTEWGRTQRGGLGGVTVASMLGAFPERLSGHPRSVAVQWNAPPADWNAALLDAAGVAASRHAPPERAAVVSS
jgi:hypothetical protein